MSRRLPVLAVLLALLPTTSCLDHVYDGKYSMTEDREVWRFDRKVDLHSTAMMPATGGGWLVLWTDREGLWSMLVDREARPEREPEKLASMWAGRMAATDLGGVCQPLGARYAVALAPLVNVLEGSDDLRLILLDGNGLLVGSLTMQGRVGPYSSGVNLLGSCDGLLVAWHRGAIGKFESEIAGIDVRNVQVDWEKTINEPGTNGFCPSMIQGEEGVHLFWGELRVRMKSSASEDDEPGRIVHARIDMNGEMLSSRHAVLESHCAHVPPSLVHHGTGLAMLYKDHPMDEYREGIYLAFLSRKGSVVGETHRIARGDGPDPASLHVLGDGTLATAAIRSLSNELLIGLNFLDGEGAKRSGELQIYAHQVRFRRVAALDHRDGLVLLYVEQRAGSTRLLMTWVAPVR